MIFVENQYGEKVATATAFYDIHGNKHTRWALCEIWDIIVPEFIRRQIHGLRVKYIKILASDRMKKVSKETDSDGR